MWFVIRTNIPEAGQETLRSVTLTPGAKRMSVAMQEGYNSLIKAHRIVLPKGQDQCPTKFGTILIFVPIYHGGEDQKVSTNLGQNRWSIFASGSKLNAPKG